MQDAELASRRRSSTLPPGQVSLGIIDNDLLDPLKFDKETARAESELLQLEDVLFDSFSAGYFLRYAQSEFSSENVEMLLALRKLQRMPPDDQRATDCAHAICKDHIMMGAKLEVVLPSALARFRSGLLLPGVRVHGRRRWASSRW